MDMGMLFATTAMPFDAKAQTAAPQANTPANAQTGMNAETAKAVTMPFTHALKTVANGTKAKPGTATDDTVVTKEQISDDNQLIAAMQAPLIIIDAVEKTLAEDSEEIASLVKDTAASMKVLTKEFVDTSVGRLLSNANQMQKDITSQMAQNLTEDDGGEESQLKILENAARFAAHGETPQDELLMKENAKSFADTLHKLDAANVRADEQGEKTETVNVKDLFGDKLKETAKPYTSQTEKQILPDSESVKQSLISQAVKAENGHLPESEEETKQTSGKEQNLQTVSAAKKTDETIVKAASDTDADEQSATDNLKQQTLDLATQANTKKQVSTTNLATDKKMAIGETSSEEKTSEPVFTLQNIMKDFAPEKITIKDPIARVDDPREIVDKMVEQARLMQKPGMSEMVIRLRPQNLGDMTIRIIAENGGAITASFHSNNSEVRGILQEMLPAMKQELSNSGLKVNDVGIYAGLGDFQSFTQHRQQADETGRTFKVGSVRRTKEEEELFEQLQAKSGENQSNDGGVDYRV